MSDTATAAHHPAAQDAAGTDALIHIASWWQGAIRHGLLRRVPVALCGTSLAYDPAAAQPVLGVSPHCPACLRANDDKPGRVDVPGH